VATNPTAERPVFRPRSRIESGAVLRREWHAYGRRIQWEAVFFGLLAGLGLACLLVLMVLGGLIAAGTSDVGNTAASQVHRLSVGGGAILVAIVALSYLAGGYVAARMARFDGWRQGLGVWLLTALIVLVVAVSAWLAGGQLNPGDSISLPANSVHEGPLTNGWIAAAVAAVVALASAIGGGLVGERFHRAVDRAGLDWIRPEAEETEPEEWQPETDEYEDDDEETVVQGTA
jgi:cytochrome bd-type quinol oxidase subunit 2